MSIVQETARTYLEEGFSVIPVSEDKKSIGGWKEFQKRRLTETELPKKFNGAQHMAVICGEISGQLEGVDVDDVDCWEPFQTMVKAKHADILDKLIFHQTPRGFSLIYRAESRIGGNRKLSMTWDKVDGPGEYNWNDRADVQARKVGEEWVVSTARIETRGEAGYFLTYPSPGYKILEGSFVGLKPISEEERHSILTIARSFDQRPPEQVQGHQKNKKYEDKGKTIPYPSDIWNREVDPEGLLLEYGWTRVGKTADGVTFARPGHKKRIGGTLYDDGMLMVFSSNAAPLEESKQYSAFGVLAAYDFENDWKAATQHVIEQGYHVEMTVEELKEVLEDNPDELEEAYKRSGLSESEVSQVACELGLELPQGKRPGRIEVLYDKLELNRVVGEVDAALVKVVGEWGYYRFSDRVGYVTDSNTFQPYDKDTLELRCEHSMYMTQWESGKNGKGPAKLKQCRVHGHILQKMLTYPDTSAPEIKGFSNHPVIGQDGKVIGLKDGFESGIMFKGVTGKGFKVDDRSFSECYQRVTELFCGDILFRNQELGRALFVSMMMTAVTRMGIQGGCPGYFITANEPGTGKSTMFEFVSRIVYGRLVESVDWGTDQGERRKEIIACLREGQECFLFDNIQQGEEVKSPILAQAISAGEFKARIMGKGEMTYVPAQSMFVFIGNNLNMSTELARRLMTIELLAKSQNPAQRKVQIVDVAGHCAEHRVEVIGCLLKMVQEGFSMTKEIERSSGFPAWDDMVRNPLYVETGIEVAGGFETSSNSSEETAGVGELLWLLVEVFGVGTRFTAKEVYLAIADERGLSEREMEQAGKIRAMKEDECGMLRDGMVMWNAKSVSNLKSTGRVMAAMKDRVVGQYRFIRHETKSKAPVKHWVEYTGEE